MSTLWFRRFDFEGGEKAVNIAPGVLRSERLEVTRLHRLLEFERVFTLYLEGKTSAEHVKQRAKKMLEVGLPRLK